MQTDIKYTHKQADSDTGNTFAQYFEEPCQALGINMFGQSSVAHEEMFFLPLLPTELFLRHKSNKKRLNR